MGSAMQNFQTAAHALATVGATDTNVDVKVGSPPAKAALPAHALQIPQLPQPIGQLTWIALSSLMPWPACRPL